MNLVAFWLGSAAGALSVAGLAVDRFRSRRALPFEPPACYVCDHLGPTGVLVPKLPCCLACRVAINAEVERALNPWAEEPAAEPKPPRWAEAEAANREYAAWLARRTGASAAPQEPAWEPWWMPLVEGYSLDAGRALLSETIDGERRWVDIAWLEDNRRNLEAEAFRAEMLQ